MRRRPLTSEQRRQRQEREAWGQQWSRCWACGKVLLGRYGEVWVEDASQIHEIVPKGHTADWCDQRNFSVFCNRCHPNGSDSKAGGLTTGMVLTLKLLLDPEHYDLDWILEHSTRKHWRPEPLPEQCEWLLSDAAITERKT